jgi:hypothetical protein
MQKAFAPLKVAEGMTLAVRDQQATILPERPLDYERMLRVIERVTWWIGENRSHPRGGDAEIWLDMFEKQIPEPSPRPDLTDEQMERIELKIQALGSFRHIMKKGKWPERRIDEMIHKFALLMFNLTD